MTRASFLAASLLVQAAFLFSPGLGRAQTSSSAILAGRVSSQEEGPMEGVLISARRAGSIFTVTVVSDAQGRYSFPQKRLEPGRYTLRIRAAGYDLQDPGTVEITAQKTASLDLKLRKTQDLAAQLTNAEWLMSMPGTEQQKAKAQCSLGCHTLERIVRSHHNAAEWMKVNQRMGTYSANSIKERLQLLPRPPEGAILAGAADDAVLASQSVPTRTSAALAEYLSTVNLSSGSTWQYSLKTLPRPKGKATRAIVTEYDLPRPYTQPHDATVASDGSVWYCDFGQQFFGRLDPKTAQFVEYPLPTLKADDPKGCRTLEFDPNGDVWISMGDQGAAAKFDRKTRKVQTWIVPKNSMKDGAPRATMVQPGHLNVDGKVWVQTPWGPQGRTKKWMIQRLDARTGEWEKPLDVYQDLPKNSPWAKRPHSIYDIFADSQNNIYGTDFSSELLVKVDAKTGKVSYYQTPTFNSAPRRGHFDPQGRFWFGEDRANRIAMFDPKTEKIQEWPISTPFSGAYDVVLDKNGDAWTGGMLTDRITRLNTKTGEMIEYLLPRSTNLRKVEVDDSSNPVAFWVGNNHASSLVKLEPLE
jgi:streptogramin lyase